MNDQLAFGIVVQVEALSAHAVSMHLLRIKLLDVFQDSLEPSPVIFTKGFVSWPPADHMELSVTRFRGFRMPAIQDRFGGFRFFKFSRQGVCLQAEGEPGK